MCRASGTQCTQPLSLALACWGGGCWPPSLIFLFSSGKGDIRPSGHILFSLIGVGGALIAYVVFFSLFLAHDTHSLTIGRGGTRTRSLRGGRSGGRATGSDGRTVRDDERVDDASSGGNTQELKHMQEDIRQKQHIAAGRGKGGREGK